MPAISAAAEPSMLSAGPGPTYAKLLFAHNTVKNRIK
jgi:hypothetical protein